MRPHTLTWRADRNMIRQRIYINRISRWVKAILRTWRANMNMNRIKQRTDINMINKWGVEETRIKPWTF